MSTKMSEPLVATDDDHLRCLVLDSPVFSLSRHHGDRALRQDPSCFSGIYYQGIVTCGSIPHCDKTWIGRSDTESTIRAEFFRDVQWVTIRSPASMFSQTPRSKPSHQGSLQRHNSLPVGPLRYLMQLSLHVNLARRGSQNGTG